MEMLMEHLFTQDLNQLLFYIKTSGNVLKLEYVMIIKDPGYNVATKNFKPNLADVEEQLLTFMDIDLLSNGFKLEQVSMLLIKVVFNIYLYGICRRTISRN
jgi:hypothetical protein